MTVQQEIKLDDEAGRVAAVHRYEFLDAPPEAEFEQLTALLKTMFGVPIAFISLIDDKRQVYTASLGLDIGSLPRNETFCEHTLMASHVMVVEDARVDERFSAHPMVTGEPGIRSYLGAPLTSPEGYNVGTVCVVDFHPRRFDEMQLEMLRQFANVVVSQLELRQIATRDGLTGAWSRRAFQEVARKELARFHRHGAPAALMMFDLDHFKAINDTHGHGIGDVVLKTAVSACRDAMREEEVIGRIGGEEFGVLLLGATVQRAEQAAERLRSAIEAARIEEKPDLRFTASFGVCVCHHDVGTVEEWFAAADKALYDAKIAGRNRCAAAQAA